MYGGAFEMDMKSRVEYIIKITCLDSNIKEEDNEYLNSDYNKIKILEYFQRNDFYCELNFISGYLLYPQPSLFSHRPCDAILSII